MNEQEELQSRGTGISPIIIHLLKGVLYRDNHQLLWQNLLNLKGAVRDYTSVINLECIIDETEGYAYLKQKAENDETGAREIPRLVQRRPLGYRTSLLCVLLRKKLVEADASAGESRVILTKEQIIEMMSVFLPEANNEVKLIDQIDTYINRIVDYGFLRKLKGNNNSYELRRIIKAFVDADWIASVDEKLKLYREYADAESK